MSLPETPHHNWKDRQVIAYLKERTQAGDRYFKSKYIAREIALSSKEIGATMAKLQASRSSLEVEKWTKTSPATWFVKPAVESGQPSEAAIENP